MVHFRSGKRVTSIVNERTYILLDNWLRTQSLIVYEIFSARTFSHSERKGGLEGGGEGGAIIRWISSSSAITENSWWILTDITVF